MDGMGEGRGKTAHMMCLPSFSSVFLGTEIGMLCVPREPPRFVDLCSSQHEGEVERVRECNQRQCLGIQTVNRQRSARWERAQPQLMFPRGGWKKK